jgi:hypothetical protein
MSTSVVNEVVEMLNDDLVSHGFFAQCVSHSCGGATDGSKFLGEILADLLSTREVEVGETRQENPGYLEFVAWRGTVKERVERASEAVRHAVGHDKEFAYWLCLRRNIDRYE